MTSSRSTGPRSATASQRESHEHARREFLQGLAIVVAVTFGFPGWVRPHLIPPVQATVTLSTASINGFTLSPDDRTLSVQTAPPDIPGAWILASQLITADGRSASAIPVTRACGPTASGTSCQAYVASLHLRQAVTYQPASRYWPLQWYEAAIYLAAALTSIAPGAGRPARVLERSP